MIALGEMGSCLSTPKSNSKESSNVVSRREGGRTVETRSNNNPRSKDNAAPKEKAKYSQKKAEGRKLGGDEPTTAELSAREAGAKAAEERYKKQKEKLQTSEKKLLEMSRKSRSEKAL